MTELNGGPWVITGNDYLGPVPDTYALAAFATHSTHNLTLSDNTIAPSGPTGKTWRFLVMTQQGFNDVVSNNTVIGVGPMDSDTVVDPNASEIILTEAYTVHYEGMVSSISPDGLTIQIPPPQGTEARTGDIVAILTGPQAGQWRTIAQVINPQTYVLNTPITPGSFAVSLDTGFVNETFQGNTINAIGSSTAQDMVLVGSQFGVTVANNTFEGGLSGFKLTATPSEVPVVWGWTHDPFLSATITGNTIQDTVQGGILDVEHSSYTTADAGRVYFTGSFLNNTGIWTAPFLAAQSAAGNHGQPVFVTVGDSLSVDPGELVLTESGNQVSGPSGVVAGATFQVDSATINGQAVRNTGEVLPIVGSSPSAAAHPLSSRPDSPIVRAPRVTTALVSFQRNGSLVASAAARARHAPPARASSVAIAPSAPLWLTLDLVSRFPARTPIVATSRSARAAHPTAVKAVGRGDSSGGFVGWFARRPVRRRPVSAR